MYRKAADDGLLLSITTDPVIPLAIYTFAAPKEYTTWRKSDYSSYSCVKMDTADKRQLVSAYTNNEQWCHRQHDQWMASPSIDCCDRDNPNIRVRYVSDA